MTLAKPVAAALLSTLLAGCFGHNGLTQRVLKFNLTEAEHRWAREFLFVGMMVIPVYPVCIIVDLLILNSIEFWTGENPVNGRSAIVDVPRSEIDKLGLDNVDVARIERRDENRAWLYVEFTTGDRVTFDVVRDGDTYTISYRGVEFLRGGVRL